MIDALDQGLKVDGLETVFLEVYHIDLLLRVLKDLFGGCFRPELRVAQGDHPRIIRAHPVDCAGAQSVNNPGQSSFTFDPRAPPVRVV